MVVVGQEDEFFVEFGGEAVGLADSEAVTKGLFVSVFDKYWGLLFWGENKSC